MVWFFHRWCPGGVPTLGQHCCCPDWRFEEPQWGRHNQQQFCIPKESPWHVENMLWRHSTISNKRLFCCRTHQWSVWFCAQGVIRQKTLVIGRVFFFISHVFAPMFYHFVWPKKESSQVFSVLAKLRVRVPKTVEVDVDGSVMDWYDLRHSLQNKQNCKKKSGLMYQFVSSKMLGEFQFQKIMRFFKESSHLWNILGSFSPSQSQSDSGFTSVHFWGDGMMDGLSLVSLPRKELALLSVSKPQKMWPKTWAMNKKPAPGCLVGIFFGEEKLPSYMGIIS